MTSLLASLVLVGCSEAPPPCTPDIAAWMDEDGDGWGSGASLAFDCVSPNPDAVMLGGDCDENDPLENPGSPEDCEDGIDNNCDFLVDADDPTCLPECADDRVVNSIAGSTVNQGNDFAPTCVGASSNDYALAFTAPDSRVYEFNTQGSNYDTGLAVFDGCGGAQLGCNDDDPFNWPNSKVSVYLTAGQQVVVVVEGWSLSQGNFVLNVL